jgi:hypothetical protein
MSLNKTQVQLIELQDQHSADKKIIKSIRRELKQARSRCRELEQALGYSSTGETLLLKFTKAIGERNEAKKEAHYWRVTYQDVQRQLQSDDKFRTKASKFEKAAFRFHKEREEARSIALFLKSRMRLRERESTYRWLEVCEQENPWLRGGSQ